MSVAWHPNRWWTFCVPEDEKKEIESIFRDLKIKFANIEIFVTLDIVRKSLWIVQTFLSLIFIHLY